MKSLIKSLKKLKSICKECELRNRAKVEIYTHIVSEKLAGEEIKGKNWSRVNIL